MPDEFDTGDEFASGVEAPPSPEAEQPQFVEGGAGAQAEYLPTMPSALDQYYAKRDKQIANLRKQAQQQPLYRLNGQLVSQLPNPANFNWYKGMGDTPPQVTNADVSFTPVQNEYADQLAKATPMPGGKAFGSNQVASNSDLIFRNLTQNLDGKPFSLESFVNNPYWNNIRQQGGTPDFVAAMQHDAYSVLRGRMKDYNVHVGFGQELNKFTGEIAENDTLGTVASPFLQRFAALVQDPGKPITASDFKMFDALRAKASTIDDNPELKDMLHSMVASTDPLDQRDYLAVQKAPNDRAMLSVFARYQNRQLAETKRVDTLQTTLSNLFDGIEGDASKQAQDYLSAMTTQHDDKGRPVLPNAASLDGLVKAMLNSDKPIHYGKDGQYELPGLWQQAFEKKIIGQIAKVNEGIEGVRMDNILISPQGKVDVGQNKDKLIADDIKGRFGSAKQLEVEGTGDWVELPKDKFTDASGKAKFLPGGIINGDTVYYPRSVINKIKPMVTTAALEGDGQIPLGPGLGRFAVDGANPYQPNFLTAEQFLRATPGQRLAQSQQFLGDAQLHLDNYNRLISHWVEYQPDASKPTFTGEAWKAMERSLAQGALEVAEFGNTIGGTAIGGIMGMYHKALGAIHAFNGDRDKATIESETGQSYLDTIIPYFKEQDERVQTRMGALDDRMDYLGKLVDWKPNQEAVGSARVGQIAGGMVGDTVSMMAQMELMGPSELGVMAGKLGTKLVGLDKAIKVARELQFPTEIEKTMHMNNLAKLDTWRQAIKMMVEFPALTAVKGQAYEQDNFGLREDGTPKGRGWLGILHRPDGDISTELSIGVNFDGKERLIPSLVPTLNDEEKKYMLSVPAGKMFTANPQMSKEIVRKAVDFARGRIRQGKSPFAEEGEGPMRLPTPLIESALMGAIGAGLPQFGRGMRMGLRMEPPVLVRGGKVKFNWPVRMGAGATAVEEGIGETGAAYRKAVAGTQSFLPSPSRVAATIAAGGGLYGLDWVRQWTEGKSHDEMVEQWKNPQDIANKLAFLMFTIIGQKPERINGKNYFELQKQAEIDRGLRAELVNQTTPLPKNKLLTYDPRSGEYTVLPGEGGIPPVTPPPEPLLNVPGTDQMVRTSREGMGGNELPNVQPKGLLPFGKLSEPKVGQEGPTHGHPIIPPSQQLRLGQMKRLENRTDLGGGEAGGAGAPKPPEPVKPTPPVAPSAPPTPEDVAAAKVPLAAATNDSLKVVIDDIVAGKPVPPATVEAVKETVKDRVEGKTPVWGDPPKEVPTPDLSKNKAEDLAKDVEAIKTPATAETEEQRADRKNKEVPDMAADIWKKNQGGRKPMSREAAIKEANRIWNERNPDPVEGEADPTQALLESSEQINQARSKRDEIEKSESTKEGTVIRGGGERGVEGSSANRREGELDAIKQKFAPEAVNHLFGETIRIDHVFHSSDLGRQLERRANKKGIRVFFMRGLPSPATAYIKKGNEIIFLNTEIRDDISTVFDHEIAHIEHAKGNPLLVRLAGLVDVNSDAATRFKNAYNKVAGPLGISDNARLVDEATAYLSAGVKERWGIKIADLFKDPMEATRIASEYYSGSPVEPTKRKNAPGQGRPKGAQTTRMEAEAKPGAYETGAAEGQPGQLVPVETSTPATDLLRQERQAHASEIASIMDGLDVNQLDALKSGRAKGYDDVLRSIMRANEGITRGDAKIRLEKAVDAYKEIRAIRDAETARVEAEKPDVETDAKIVKGVKDEAVNRKSQDDQGCILR